MTLKRLLIGALCALLSTPLLAQDQSMDDSLSKLADNLAALIKEHSNKKVTVLDFTDLQGGQSELGRYIAEQLTVDMVMGKHDFAVLDGANLKSILAEHKLTSEGLVNPDNAKKLGQFAGVDALVIGNIISMNSNVQLTVKIITTDTAEIIGAAKAQFKSDDTVQKFLGQPMARNEAGTDRSGPADAPVVVKSFGDMRVELQSLHIVTGSPSVNYQKEFLLTMVVANQNPKKSIWVALNTDLGNAPKIEISDPDGNQFHTYWNAISGVAYAAYQHGGFFKATEIKPGDSLTATVKFISANGVNAATGICRLQMEILLGHEFQNGFGNANVQNLVTKVLAN